ncbi:MAG: hypothetical protein ACI4II_09735 [Acutalibacteraceae bacterium]
MKKRIIIIISAVLLIVVSFGVTDFIRVKQFEKPIFCILTDGADDGGSGKYIGIGYSFDIKGNFMPEDELPGVTHYTYNIMGVEVRSGVRD